MAICTVDPAAESTDDDSMQTVPLNSPQKSASEYAAASASATELLKPVVKSIGYHNISDTKFFWQLRLIPKNHQQMYKFIMMHNGCGLFRAEIRSICQRYDMTAAQLDGIFTFARTSHEIYDVLIRKIKHEVRKLNLRSSHASSFVLSAFRRQDYLNEMTLRVFSLIPHFHSLEQFLPRAYKYFIHTLLDLNDKLRMDEVDNINFYADNASDVIRTQLGKLYSSLEKKLNTWCSECCEILDLCDDGELTAEDAILLDEMIDNGTLYVPDELEDDPIVKEFYMWMTREQGEFPMFSKMENPNYQSNYSRDFPAHKRPLGSAGTTTLPHYPVDHKIWNNPKITYTPYVCKTPYYEKIELDKKLLPLNLAIAKIPSIYVHSILQCLIDHQLALSSFELNENLCIMVMSEANSKRFIDKDSDLTIREYFDEAHMTDKLYNKFDRFLALVANSSVYWTYVKHCPTRVLLRLLSRMFNVRFIVWSDDLSSTEYDNTVYPEPLVVQLYQYTAEIFFNVMPASGSFEPVGSVRAEPAMPAVTVSKSCCNDIKKVITI